MNKKIYLSAVFLSTIIIASCGIVEIFIGTPATEIELKNCEGVVFEVTIIQGENTELMNTVIVQNGIAHLHSLNKVKIDFENEVSIQLRVITAGKSNDCEYKLNTVFISKNTKLISINKSMQIYAIDLNSLNRLNQ